MGEIDWWGSSVLTYATACVIGAIAFGFDGSWTEAGMFATSLVLLVSLERQRVRRGFELIWVAQLLLMLLPLIVVFYGPRS